MVRNRVGRSKFTQIKNRLFKKRAFALKGFNKRFNNIIVGQLFAVSNCYIFT